MPDRLFIGGFGVAYTTATRNLASLLFLSIRLDQQTRNQLPPTPAPGPASSEIIEGLVCAPGACAMGAKPKFVTSSSSRPRRG